MIDLTSYDIPFETDFGPMDIVTTSGYTLSEVMYRQFVRIRDTTPIATLFPSRKPCNHPVTVLYPEPWNILLRFNFI